MTFCTIRIYHTLRRLLRRNGPLNWSVVWRDLVVIDESHNFRNGGDADKEGKENRYTRLMNKRHPSGRKGRGY